jgi:hypothetical protein
MSVIGDKDVYPPAQSHNHTFNTFRKGRKVMN